jgi:hypothetical protein
MLIEMVQKAPDVHEPLPISNRKETIIGSTIPFLVRRAPKLQKLVC